MAELVRSRALPAVAFGGITALTAAAGALATRSSVDSVWYRRLRKSKLQPPKGAFGPVWTALYALIAASGYRVWRARPSPERTRALALWGAQLVLNGGWSAIFFGARRPRLALAELGVLLSSIALYMGEARKVDRTAAWLVAPYAGWSGFASLLNAEIVRKNP
jgi:tryptophan-rich sensory protein